MKSLAFFVYIVAGVISFFWSMSVIVEQVGFGGGVLAFFLFPVTILFTPFYLGFNSGDWTLAGITYGGGILASIMHRLSSNDASIESALPGTSQTAIAQPHLVPPTSLVVSHTNSSDSPAVDENANGLGRPYEKPLWLIILGIFVFWKVNQTNFEYAFSYCAANYFIGFLIAGIVWLFGARKGRTWTLGAWLNYAAYGMVWFLILAFIVRISVENSVQSTGQRGSNIGVQPPSMPNLPQPPSQSSPLHPEPIDQNNQFGSTPGPPLLTERQLTRMQRLLVKLGYRPGPIDGHAGPRTREAIRAFEKFHSWPETGEPSERLLSYLESRAAILAVGNPDLEKPDCVLKQVMTDDDYRACGLKPPPSH